MNKSTRRHFQQLYRIINSRQQHSKINRLILIRLNPRNRLRILRNIPHHHPLPLSLILHFHHIIRHTIIDIISLLPMPFSPPKIYCIIKISKRSRLKLTLNPQICILEIRRKLAHPESQPIVHYLSHFESYFATSTFVPEDGWVDESSECFSEKSVDFDLFVVLWDEEIGVGEIEVEFDILYIYGVLNKFCITNVSFLTSSKRFLKSFYDLSRTFLVS